MNWYKQGGKTNLEGNLFGEENDILGSVDDDDDVREKEENEPESPMRFKPVLRCSNVVCGYYDAPPATSDESTPSGS